VLSFNHHREVASLDDPAEADSLFDWSEVPSLLGSTLLFQGSTFVSGRIWLLWLFWLPFARVCEKTYASVQMKIAPYVGLAVLVVVFASAMIGRLIRRKLPESHLSDETKAVVTLSTGVVGTLTALVLGLLIATASTTFNTRNQEITTLAAKVIRLDRLLRRYGPDADDERERLRNYLTMKLEDLFPKGHAKSVLENPKTIVLFEDLEDRLSVMEGQSPHQRWLLSHALSVTTEIAEVRWRLIEQDVIGIPVPVLLVVVFWLCLLFVSFGLFSPQNTTATVALFFLRNCRCACDPNDPGPEQAFRGCCPGL
jgi:hypothetical protein